MQENVYELRENAWHALIRNFTGLSHYECGEARRPRKAFFCDACETTIDVGMGPRHYLKAYGDDGYWPTTNICGPCFENPEVQKAIVEIRSGKYDYD